MKSLIYKEFKLAMHPICYIFMFLFPFMMLIPHYPVAISFIYILSAYPILFLGANKGQQSNDLLFTTLLPVRKKDIVLARMITCLTMQVVGILITIALHPLAAYINSIIPVSDPNLASLESGIPLSGLISIIAIVIIGYTFADLIYFPIYYKKGKSIVLSTLLTILFYALFISTFTIVIVYIPGCEWYLDILANKGILPQLILLVISIIFSIIGHYLSYKISYKRLEKVDF